MGPTERHSSSFPRESPVRHLPRCTVRHKTLRSYRVSSLLLDRLSIHRRNPSQSSSSFVRLFLVVRRWQQGGGGRVWLGGLRKCAKMQDCYPGKRATNHQTMLFHLPTPIGIGCVAKKWSIRSISAAAFGRATSPGGLGMPLVRLPPNQNTT